MSQLETYDFGYAVCPACNEHHGDCWEWLTDEGRSVEFECQGCGAKLEASVAYHTTYTTVLKESRP